MATNVVQEFQIGGYTYEQRNVFCNKPLCKSCPHGPYWYMRFTRRDGKPITKYVGKELPIGVEPPC